MWSNLSRQHELFCSWQIFLCLQHFRQQDLLLSYGIRALNQHFFKSKKTAQEYQISIFSEEKTSKIILSTPPSSFGRTVTVHVTGSGRHSCLWRTLNGHSDCRESLCSSSPAPGCYTGEFVTRPLGVANIVKYHWSHWKTRVQECKKSTETKARCWWQL